MLPEQRLLNGARIQRRGLFRQEFAPLVCYTRKCAREPGFRLHFWVASRSLKNFHWRDSAIKTLRIVARAKQRSLDRKSTRLNSSHANISYAVFCLQKKRIILVD